MEYCRLGVVEFKWGFPAAVCEYGADDGQQFGSIALDGWLQQSFGVFADPGTDALPALGSEKLILLTSAANTCRASSMNDV